MAKDSGVFVVGPAAGSGGVIDLSGITIEADEDEKQMTLRKGSRVAVYRPEGPPARNVFTSWWEAYAALTEATRP